MRLGTTRARGGVGRGGARAVVASLPALALLLALAGGARAPPPPSPSPCRETGQQRGGLTTSSGAYTVLGLPPGRYNVSVQMLGYGTQQRDINLLVGQ